MIYQRSYLNIKQKDKKKETLTNVMSALAESLTLTQVQIDEITKRNLIRWETEGIIPSGYMISNFVFNLTTEFDFMGKNNSVAKSEIVVNNVYNKINSISLKISFKPNLYIY